MDWILTAVALSITVILLLRRRRQRREEKMRQSLTRDSGQWRWYGPDGRKHTSVIHPDDPGGSWGPRSSSRGAWYESGTGSPDGWSGDGGDGGGGGD